MNTQRKIALLNRLLKHSSGVTVKDSSDPAFKTWKNTVERTLLRVFGQESPEYDQFQKLRFFYQAGMMLMGHDYSSEHRQAFGRDYEILTLSIRNYIEELEEDVESENVACSDHPPGAIQRVFISHSSADCSIAEELIELLELIGVSSEAIFCTSVDGYGIDLGEHFLDVIRDELSGDVLVLFLLTPNFFRSPVCLCEMGATWALTREHIPVLVPPLEFSEVEGVLPLTQGLNITDELKLNLLKERVESLLGVCSDLSQVNWERKRDRVMKRIGERIEASK